MQRPTPSGSISCWTGCDRARPQPPPAHRHRPGRAGVTDWPPLRTFGEFLLRLPRSATDVDRMLAAGYFAQRRSADDALRHRRGQPPPDRAGHQARQSVAMREADPARQARVQASGPLPRLADRPRPPAPTARHAASGMRHGASGGPGARVRASGVARRARTGGGPARHRRRRPSARPAGARGAGQGAARALRAGRIWRRGRTTTARCRSGMARPSRSR